ncbi:SPASM domain-containing protein [Malonomonas rubra]|uniref:SPASM domain-containing protein n=1 Tax=Malonomonas rubra TaxID=57040 RepID=UPI0026F0D3CD|nr:SPASM domain-containing protein [Malonomonas rubra]
MAVDLLDAPLRVSWDLCGGDGKVLSAAQLSRVAQQLLDAGIFFVSLEEQPLLHPEIIPLLQSLVKGCQVSVVVGNSETELNLLGQLPQTIKLYLDCSQAVQGHTFNGDCIRPALSRIRNSGYEPLLSWMPRRSELPALLAALRFCAAESIRGFKLPNQKIGVSCGPEQAEKMPDCEDLKQLAAAIRKSGLPKLSELQLDVHDLFVWELLQPLSGGQRSEYGGCQAANSLGHITADGQLWPCSSWPEPLGSLLENDLIDLWQSDLRFEIRRQIAEIPVGCTDCRDYESCFGGCRGLSSFCRDDSLKRDLLCEGIR